MKKHTTATDLPTTEQIARERSRLRYKRRYGRTLRSTAAQTAHMGRRALLRCRRRDRLCALTRPALTMTQQTFCGQEAHTHDESCYETILICGQDEQLPVEQPTPHVHTEDCYAAHLVLVCGQEENEEHTHTEDCCQTQYELICPLEEG